MYPANNSRFFLYVTFPVLREDGGSATSEQEGQDNQPRHMVEVLCGSVKGSEDHWRHRPER